MKRILLLLALVVCQIYSAFSQDQKLIDSLENLVKTSTNDTVRLTAFGDLSWEYGYSNFDKALYYAQEELKLAEKMNDIASTGQAYSDIGNAYTRVNKVAEALVNHQKAYELRLKAGLKDKAAGSLSNISVIYKQQSKYALAVEYMTKALKIYEELKDEPRQALVMGNLASVLIIMKKFDEGRVVLDRTMQISQRLKIAPIERNTYSIYTEYFFNKRQIDSALFFAFKALRMMEEVNAYNDMALMYNSIGQLYIEKKQYDLSMKYYKKSLEIREAIEDELGIGSCCKNIAYCYIALSRFSEAEKYLNRAIECFKNVDSKDYLREAYLYMMDVYRNRNDYKTALKYHMMAQEMKDSVFNQQSMDHINELRVEYETEKKEQQIVLLNKENEIHKLELTRKNILVTVVVVIFAVAGLVAYLLYNRNRLKQEAKLQAEIILQQDLASKGIIEAEERERKRIAGDLHDGVGQMFSAVRMNLSGLQERVKFEDESTENLYDKTLALVDESCKEVRSISHNMMPNVLLRAGLASAVKDFIDKIDSRKLKVNLETVGLKDRLDSDVEMVLYRVIQEAVNNVIKHSGANHLDIQMVKDEEGITATIEDNGVGFDANNKDKFEGIGLKNIKTRIEYLKGSVEFESAPGKGTLVAIHIPIKA
jgi:two-component system NarL family sensor kinase